MCGIAGELRFDGAPVSDEKLRRMGAALFHRGPDGEGRDIIGPCGLAHRRLAIIDLSEGGHQPMSVADGQVWISFNGEVYNYVELREELRAKGHRFQSESDTEVVLHAYLEWGTKAFERFNGMWAIAIWDARDDRLILSRDRVGIKPLYVHRNGSRFLFGSEPKALLAAEPELAKPDVENVARFLERSALSFVHDSFFEGVHALPPGTILIVDREGRERSESYWPFRPSTPTIDSVEESVERVKELFIDAVRLRFRSDVDVGSCLSGGLDSSSIVSVAARILNEHPKTFSAVYETEGYNEGHYVRSLVKDLGVQSFEVAPDGGDLPEVIEAATYHQDGPTGGPGVYSQWRVMQLAGQHVKVLLDGQGGDELFGGYFHNFEQHVRALLSRAARGDPRAMRELARGDVEIRGLTGTSPLRKVLSLGLAARRPKARALAGRFGRRPASWADRILARGARTLMPPPVSKVAGIYVPIVSEELSQRLSAEEKATWPTPRVTPDALTDYLWDEIQRTSLPGLLHYEDRDAMAFSIEARVPFLDHRLIELSFQLPSEAKIYLADTKRVLRLAMQGIVPDDIRLRRDKMGYPTPLHLWLRDRHADWMRDILLSPAAKARGFTRFEEVEKAVDRHIKGEQNHGPQLYRALVLELYARRFLDEPFEAKPAPELAQSAS